MGRRRRRKKPVRGPGRKAEAQFRHARTRARQRYLLDLTRSYMARLVEQIQSQNGKATLVAKQSGRVRIYNVTLDDGSQATVVYDRQRKTISSFLPLIEP